MAAALSIVMIATDPLVSATRLAPELRSGFTRVRCSDADLITARDDGRRVENHLLGRLDPRKNLDRVPEVTAKRDRLHDNLITRTHYSNLNAVGPEQQGIGGHSKPMSNRWQLKMHLDETPGKKLA